MRATSTQTALAALVAVAIAAPGLATHAQDQPRQGQRSALMRQKLELSKQILEGLTTDDLDLVAGAAKKLKVLGEEAEWGEPAPRDRKQYRALLGDFLRRATELGQESRARNVDRASIAYMQLTLTCIECHRLARDEQSQPEGR